MLRKLDDRGNRSEDGGWWGKKRLCLLVQQYLIKLPNWDPLALIYGSFGSVSVTVNGSDVGPTHLAVHTCRFQVCLED